MVNKPLLPFASFSMRDGLSFEIDEDGFRELEAAYGTSMPNEEAKKQLLAIGNAYVDRCQRELSWGTWRDVKTMLPPLRKAVGAFWNLAYRARRRTNPSVQLEALFARHLREQVVPLDPERGDLCILTDEGWVPYAMPDGSYGICLSSEMLQRLAMSLSLAISLTRTDIDEEIKTSGPPRLAAIDQLILQLTGWAKKFRLPRAAYVDGTLPAPFARFISRFLQFAPAECRVTKQTAAVAAQVRRVRGAAARREKGRKRTRDRANDKT